MTVDSTVDDAPRLAEQKKFGSLLSSNDFVCTFFSFDLQMSKVCNV